MMRRKLSELQGSEEGQTLLLAAIFGLVLMLCVLGTVNLGRAVYDRVQLQAAADSAAYSEAAIEARVLNLTAYTNRAMVVHYASAMAMTSYLTWVHFLWTAIKPILSVLTMLPIVGEVAAAIDQILGTLVMVLDAALVALIPALAANNVFLWGVQEGAWLSVWTRLGKAISPQAHSGDSESHPYVPIWPTLIPLMNQSVFSMTRGQLTVPQATAETAKMLLNDKSAEVQEARLHMLEIANSARTPWVAYGDRHDDPTISPAGRHSYFGLSGWGWSLGIANVARTELGTFPPGDRAARSPKAFGQIWSGQRLQGIADLLSFSGRVNLFSLIAVDDLLGNPSAPRQEQYCLLPDVPDVVAALIPGFSGALDQMSSNAVPTLPRGRRLFALSPYVYFVPRAATQGHPGPRGQLGNFAQPDVLVGLAREGRDYDQEPGAAQLYGRRFSWDGKGAGKAAADFGYTDEDWPKIPGLPRQLLHRGLNAFAAAQVYYHRPGEWREQPNFFNPLWGARLMPVAESNVVARLGLSAVLRPFVSH